MFQTRCWVMATAMGLGVSVLGAPRAGDETARGTGKTGTEVTHLVTGDPAQLNAVVAGTGPTAILAINPINPPPGMAAYPAGVTINGNELTIDRNNKDGFRAWFHVQVSNWDPGNDGPNLAAIQIKIDASGYYASDSLDVNPTPGDGLDLVPAVQACVSNTDCRATTPTGFGEAWVRCTAGFCENGYIDSAGTGSPTPEDEGWCEPNDGGCTGSGVATGTANYNYFLISDSTLGRPDNDELYYVGTLVLDLPAGAKGKYTILLNNDETFVAAPGSPPIVLESLAETGFVVNFVTTTVLRWESVINHTRTGQTDLVVPLNIPNDNTFSEPRSGVKKIVVTFDGPLDPATVIPGNVTICGNNSAGSSVNLSGVVVTTATTSGDTKMEINFAPALPDFARYRIALKTTILGAGGGAIQAGTGGLSRILTALQGDFNGDRRVISTDVGGVRSFVTTDPIDPAILNHVRADVNNDKRIISTDVGATRSFVGNDARNILDPVCP